MDRNPGQLRRETNFSTQQHKAQTYPWLSSSYGDQERASSSAAAASQGPSTTGSVTAASSSRTLLRLPGGFSRLKRLTTVTEFGRVFAHSRRSSDRYFTVLSCPNDAATARLGLTVSRRIAKHAVARNRLKRLAREAFRCEQNLPPLDIVILANKAAPAAENAVLLDSLQRHLRSITKRSN